MEKNDISLLFKNDEVYVIPEAETGKTKIDADLLLLISSTGKIENYEEIARRLLHSLKLPDKIISAQYDMSFILSLKQNCKRIVAMGFSPGQTRVHADFAYNKIIHFKEKYILLTEDLIVIDRDAAKKKRFWKLLQELLSCED